MKYPMNFPRCVATVLTVSLMGMLAGCASRSVTTPVSIDPRVLTLAAAMQTRLGIADQVAWSKYQISVPILDPEREQQVIARAVSAAGRAGLDPAMAERFFSAQVLASRTRQEELTRIWTRGGTLPSFGPVDLKDEIRPVLDQMMTELIADLKSFPDSAPARGALAAQLSAAGYSRRVVAAAMDF
jgi:chorismate mutase